MIGHPSILNSPIVRWTYVTFWEASRMGEVWLRLYKRPTFCPGTVPVALAQARVIHFVLVASSLKVARDAFLVKYRHLCLCPKH